ncbi:substrate-binding domain-containing protein [Bifidobacterium choloepi]|uniref:substrate-binding domain-containing protein n=1 Tax=Bifidobacterium choloepi TaxID=2614131 RepID=UPI0018C8B5AC|nr:substrate-binding domain-containing protein [Bifidobacterium choloepi]
MTATIRAHGLKVPDDIQVVGFDDSTIASMADPPLTTIRQPFDGIARHLVDQLMQLINGSQPLGITLPCELVVRQTTR